MFVGILSVKFASSQSGRLYVALKIFGLKPECNQNPRLLKLEAAIEII